MAQDIERIEELLRSEMYTALVELSLAEKSGRRPDRQHCGIFTATVARICLHGNLGQLLIVVVAEIELGFLMVSASPGNPRQIALEEIWQWRVNEARRTYEKQPSDETRANLLRALRILGDLSLRGKLAPETDQQ